MNISTEALLIIFGIIGAVFGFLESKPEWEKYKNGTEYWLTNHHRPFMIFILSCIVVIYNIWKILGGK